MGFAILNVSKETSFIGKVYVLKQRYLVSIAISVRHVVSLWVFAVQLEENGINVALANSF